MKSTITHTSDSIVISTPKTRSWILIFLFAVLLLQNAYGLIRSIFFEKHLLLAEQLFIFLLCPVILFLVVKGLLWQLKGVKVLEASPQKIVFKKIAPLKRREKTYDVKELRSIRVSDKTVTTGPTAMLQLLGIVDRISIDLHYAYDTVTTLSGFHIIEAKKIEQLIKTKTGVS